MGKLLEMPDEIKSCFDKGYLATDVYKVYNEGEDFKIENQKS